MFELSQEDLYFFLGSDYGRVFGGKPESPQLDWRVMLPVKLPKEVLYGRQKKYLCKEWQEARSVST